jgi:hypothetical protein
MIIISQITIKTDAVISANGVLHSDVSRLLQINEGLSSLKYELDSRISARRNIAGRMNNACNSIKLLENQASKLESFIDNSANRYIAADNLLNTKAPNVGLHVAASTTQLGSNKSGAVKQGIKSWWENLNVGIGAVTAQAKDVYSQFKKNIDPGGKWYQAFNIIKADVCMGLAAVALVPPILALVAILPETVTVATVVAAALACVSIAYGLNSLFNSTYDLVLVSADKSAETGKFDLLKSEDEFIGESVGKLSGHEKEGKLIADGIYYGGEAATVYYQLDNLKNISLDKVGNDVTTLANTDVNTKAINSIQNLVLDSKAPINIAYQDIKGFVKAAFDINKIHDGILAS